MKKINLMPSDFWNSSSFAKTLLMYQYLILTFDVKTISLLFQNSMTSLSSLSSSMSKSGSFHRDKRGVGHGMCLTASDQDRIRIFVHEFAVRALIPWAERQMRTLNDMASGTVYYIRDNHNSETLLYINPIWSHIRPCCVYVIVSSHVSVLS